MTTSIRQKETNLYYSNFFSFYLLSLALKRENDTNDPCSCLSENTKKKNLDILLLLWLPYKFSVFAFLLHVRIPLRYSTENECMFQYHRE